MDGCSRNSWKQRVKIISFDGLFFKKNALKNIQELLKFAAERE